MEKYSKEIKKNRREVLERMIRHGRSVKDMAKTLRVTPPRIYQILKEFDLKTEQQEAGSSFTFTEGKLRYMLRKRMRAADNMVEYDAVANSIGEIPEFCPILGRKIDYHLEGNEPHFDGPSFMLIEPRLGYTPGNVIICCLLANNIRGTSNSEDFEAVAKYLAKYRCKL